QAHMQGGVARVDQDRARRTGILEVDLYGEGEVKLEKGSTTQTGAKALVNLSTRGELKVKAHKSKVVQQAQPNEPLYRRALAEQPTETPKTAPEVQPAS